MRLIICKVAGHRYFDLQNIYSRFPPTYKRFHDIRGGGGEILLSKQHDVEYECLNDYNPHFYHLYFDIKHTPSAFRLSVDFVPESGHLFAINMRTKFWGRRGGSRSCEEGVQEGSSWYDASKLNFMVRNLSVNGNCWQYSPVAAKYYTDRVRSIDLIGERLKNVTVDSLSVGTYLEKPLTQDDFVVINLPTKDTLQRDFKMSKREYQEAVGACLMSDAKIMVIHEQPEEYFSNWSQSVGSTYTISTNY